MLSPMLRPLPWALLALSLSVNVLLAWGGRTAPSAAPARPLEHRWARPSAECRDCVTRAEALEAQLVAAQRELQVQRSSSLGAAASR